MTTQPEPARETYAKAHANTSGPSHAGHTSTEVQAMLDEIDELRCWKAEALDVLERWDDCYDALPESRRGMLGERKSAVVLAFIAAVKGLAR